VLLAASIPPVPLTEKPAPTPFPRWLKRAVKAPIAACRVWMLFLVDHKRLFSEAMSGNWPYHVHPTVFFALCFGLLLAGKELYRLPQGVAGTVGWFQVWDKLDKDQKPLFLVKLGINPTDIHEMLTVEPLYPGGSSASAQIKKVVGSTAAADVGLYLKGKDSELAAAYNSKAEVALRAARYEGWIFGNCSLQ
jgi:hypothetical protein